MVTRAWWWMACMVGAAAVAQAAPAPAPEPPSPEAVQRTWDYYFRGQGQGPLLVEARLCTEVGSAGERLMDCLAELPAGDVKAGTTVHVWQSYLVPRGDTVDDLRVEVRQGDVLRATRDVTVRGEGWRSRSSVKVTLGRPGTWTLSILRGTNTLRRFEVKVSP